MSQQLQLPKCMELSNDIDVAYTALEARKIAKEIGFSTADQYMISTATSELGNNIIKYAVHGIISINIVEERTSIGIEIVAKDSGPGIQDLEAAMKDKFSTGGTLGLGLSGTKRLMDSFQIDSSSTKGTRVVVKKWI